MTFLKRYALPLACAMSVLLTACATKDERREPTPLVDIKPVLNVTQAWKASVGKAGRYLFAPVAVGDAVYAAGENGSVVKIDAKTGQDIWRVKLHDDLSAGVGSDGNLTAVGGLKGNVYVLGPDGKLLWTAVAPGEIISPPLVGNDSVVVRTIDGKVIAFNAATGEQKWIFQVRAVPLNLRVAAGMTFAGSQAVLAGFPGGTFAAINLATGDAFWQTPVSFPKGVTEVERINDVTGAPTLVGSESCAVTFQGRIACFDTNTGHPQWERAFSSDSGLAQDSDVVAAGDDWSIMNGFSAIDGTPKWKNESLKNRMVSVPYILGRAVVVGDFEGYVHFLATDNGILIGRAKTDGSAITAPPVLAGDTLVVLTHDGGIYGFRPR